MVQDTMLGCERVRGLTRTGLDDSRWGFKVRKLEPCVKPRDDGLRRALRSFGELNVIEYEQLLECDHDHLLLIFNGGIWLAIYRNLHAYKG
ncbi:hypothetical protein Cob_v009481 [Colletotrichum orbiculare MAFF 240422]|uniref:Uncharacterized protein n=1 Tax=Colletotrichum orbiculare (strain 104-T / ATCC 96160 / CBS 514.97 / LARS 414 / MAFF 240422) TaxID=1213857 RepID=A0A484FHN9_COLOR|nr:hypothetical protein Cob_v009481 [Colletotrichum orbiculare MAFF 240422]